MQALHDYRDFFYQFCLWDRSHALLKQCNSGQEGLNKHLLDKKIIVL